MMGEIGCLYELQPTAAPADRLAHYSVPPEKKHARSLHNHLLPRWPSSCLHLSESNWSVVLSISTNVVLVQFWCPLYRRDLRISPIFWTGEEWLTNTGFWGRWRQRHIRRKYVSSHPTNFLFLAGSALKDFKRLNIKIMEVQLVLFAIKQSWLLIFTIAWYNQRHRPRQKEQKSIPVGTFVMSNIVLYIIILPNPSCRVEINVCARSRKCQTSNLSTSGTVTAFCESHFTLSFSVNTYKEKHYALHGAVVSNWFRL